MKNLAPCFFKKRFCNGKLRIQTKKHYPSSSTLRQIMIFQALSSLHCTKQGAHLSRACVWTWEAWRSTSCCAGCNTPQCWGSWVHLGRPPHKDGRQGRLHRTAVYAHSWWLPVSTCPDAGSTARCLSHLEKTTGKHFKYNWDTCTAQRLHFFHMESGLEVTNWATFFCCFCASYDERNVQDTELELEHYATNHWRYILTTRSQQLFRCLECTIREQTRRTGSNLSTLGSIHAPDGKHGPNSGFAGPGAGTLKQGPALRQEVILHPLHQQPLALHTVPEQRVGLQISQKLHTETHSCETTVIYKEVKQK